MSATQRTNTGRSAQFADNGGGGAFDRLDLAFFEHNGILPPTTLLEAQDDFPAEDQAFNTTVSRVMARAYMTAASPCNFGYVIPNADEVLLLLCSLYQVGFSAGIYIAQETPASEWVPKGYAVISSPSDSGLVKASGAVNGHSAIGATDTRAGARVGAIGLYWKRSTGRIASFYRTGLERWYTSQDITDLTYTDPAVNVGVQMFTQSPMQCAVPLLARRDIDASVVL